MTFAGCAPLARVTPTPVELGIGAVRLLDSLSLLSPFPLCRAAGCALPGLPIRAAVRRAGVLGRRQLADGWLRVSAPADSQTGVCVCVCVLPYSMCSAAVDCSVWLSNCLFAAFPPPFHRLSLTVRCRFAAFRCKRGMADGGQPCDGRLAGTLSASENRYLCNRVTAAIRQYVSQYYSCGFICEEQSCRFETKVRSPGPQITTTAVVFC